MSQQEEERFTVPALMIRQWLQDWDGVTFSNSDGERRRKPEPYFYSFTLSARQLRKLSNIYRRQASGPRVADTSIQRGLDLDRRDEIKRFIQGGFPWSELSEAQKHSETYADLRMPGWLPTAIIANILPSGATRRGTTIDDEDVIRVEHSSEGLARLTLPIGLQRDDWSPAVEPIEIIDGQHRLWAFDEDDRLNGEYQLPVVAFHDLDITWQAYLFYTINIKPKRINTSLAFDLYPVLRIQDWLERSPGGVAIYRETRAQELTEVLWSHPQSPWHGRVNMLGESKSGTVTQAAFIRSLMASYVKRWEGRGRGASLGGLFGAELHSGRDDVLQWSRPQQAAFLVLVWISVAAAIANTRARWAQNLRQLPFQKELPREDRASHLDPAFESQYSLLATDQGVRGILQVTNDVCYVMAESLNLAAWEWVDETSYNAEGVSEGAVSSALASLNAHPVAHFLDDVATVLSDFDWRASSTPDLSPEQRRAQAIFRGSGGYKELRQQLLELLTSADNGVVRGAANDVQKRLGY